MKPSTFFGFAGITAASVVAAVFAVSTQSDKISLTAGTEAAFPKLLAAVNDVAKIEFKNSKGSFSISRDGDEWGMDQKGGYRVEFEKVKSAIVSLSQFKLIEQKTSDPERYERLEVAMPNSPESKGRFVVLKKQDDSILASAVIGKLSPNLFGSGGAGTYIRRIGDKETWLARGKVDLGEEPSNWMARTIVDYGQEKVQRATITHPDGHTFSISKMAETDKNFVLDNVPVGRKLKNSDELNPLGGVMWRMMFDDVKKADQQKWPDKQWTAHYSTWSGVRVTIQTAKVDGEFWGRFSAKIDEGVTDEAKKNTASQIAKEINQRTANWSYKLTDGDSEKLTFPVDEYLVKSKK